MWGLRLSFPSCHSWSSQFSTSSKVVQITKKSRGFRSRSLRPIRSEPQVRQEPRLPDVGTGNEAPQLIPLESETGAKVVKLVAGQNHSVAIYENGTAKSWGYNQTGQLGHGHRDKELTIRPIIGLEGHTVVDAFLGPIQTFLSTINNATGRQAIWHFGVGYRDDTPDMKFTFHHPTPTKVLKKVYVGRETGIKKIVPAAQFCLWISESNAIYSFGEGDKTGALGHEPPMGETSIPHIPGPTKIPELESMSVVDAAVGKHHALALTAEGVVFAWGMNDYGQLGLDTPTEIFYEPRVIRAFRGIEIKQIVCGEVHSMALDSGGNVYTWGSYEDGKLGLGSDIERDVLAPRRIEALSGIGIVKLSAGVDHCAALAANGDVYLWGYGKQAALGPQNTQLANLASPNLENSVYYGGRKMSLEEYFQLAYDHRVTDVQCTMNATVLTVTSKRLPEL